MGLRLRTDLEERDGLWLFWSAWTNPLEGHHISIRGKKRACWRFQRGWEGGSGSGDTGPVQEYARLCRAGALGQVPISSFSLPCVSKIKKHQARAQRGQDDLQASPQSPHSLCSVFSHRGYRTLLDCVTFKSVVGRGAGEVTKNLPMK